MQFELWHVLFWAILTIVLVGSEIATIQLISIWFAAGSLAAFISSLFGAAFHVQVILFIAVSIILLLVTRPFVRRFLSRSPVRTNADSLIGQNCVVKEEIDNLAGTGRVFVDGLEWSAKSVDNEVFSEGARCTVTEIKGVTLIVKSAQ